MFSSPFVVARYLLSFYILICVAGCRQKVSKPYTFQKTDYSKQGMVVSVHPLASKAGVDILQRGGNAIDAAIAVEFVLAVVYPRAGNIGGGGFMVYRSAEGETSSLDFREKAPAAAHRKMYLDSLGNVITGMSTDGHLAIGVPGTVAGLFAAHGRYGTFPWARLLEPAIRLAAKGHPITSFEAARLNENRDKFMKLNDPDIPFVKERAWREGDVLIQTELSNTLQRIARHGRDEFYHGETSDYLIAEMQDGNGIITKKDLEDYDPVWRIPVTTHYRGYEIISMPPPSSGGIALIQLLEIVEPYPLHTWGHRDIKTIHLMAEAERRVFTDRAEHLGDADFYPVPVDTLLDALYLAGRMADFNPDHASVSSSIHAGNFIHTLDTYETTHLTVVDSSGNTVAMTVTLNTNYGSKVYVEGAGFFLNNEMDDFSAKPGVPNYYGLIGGEANAIAPGKRMLSAMTPTIVTKDGEFFMTAGTPGGSTIITSVFQTILNVIDFEMTATEAVSALRFHHQWLPDEIKYEQGCFSDTLEMILSGMGHTLSEIKSIGTVEVIHRLPDGTLEGAADPRESSHAIGVNSRSRGNRENR